MPDAPPPPPPPQGPGWSSPTPPPPPPRSPGGHEPDPDTSTRASGTRTVAIVLGVVVALAAIGVAGLQLLDGDDPVALPSPTTTPTERVTSLPPLATSTPTPTSPGTTAPEVPPDDPFGEDDPFAGLLPDELVLACLLPDGVEPSLSGTPLPEDPAEAIAVVAEHVEEARDLAFQSEVSLELLDSDALAERVVTLTEEDYQPEEAALDGAIMAALGQVEPDLDLRQLALDLLGEQVAGFYDPETGELVAESGGQLQPADLMIVAHELDHALTDQALGLPDLEADPTDLDGSLAAQALVEGDATVLMQHWAMTHLSIMDQLSLATPEVDTEALDSAPHALRQQLLSPYTDGMAFVCQQYVEGGWAAVDAVYEDLPTTTAQVLWPERYAAGEEAVPVAEPVAGAGWEQVRRTTWGAAELMWLVEAPGDDPSAALSAPRDRAADWAGGELTAWQADGETMVALQLAQQPGGQLCQTMTDWYRAAFPDSVQLRGDNRETVFESDERAGIVTCDGDDVRVVVAPGLDAAEAVS